MNEPIIIDPLLQDPEAPKTASVPPEMIEQDPAPAAPTVEAVKKKAPARCAVLYEDSADGRTWDCVLPRGHDGEHINYEGDIAWTAKPKGGMKLDLGCGNNVREGFDGVDLYAEKARYKVDLFLFPLPFADESVDEVHCSHFLEHLPAREVEERDLRTDVRQVGSCHLPKGETFLRQDFLFAFMDEIWRILKPDGLATLIVPCARSSRGFQDPTHRRFFVSETFGYFNAEARKNMGLSHYPVRCNFLGPVDALYSDVSLNAQHEEVVRDRMRKEWNAIDDWQARLIKKPLP